VMSEEKERSKKAVEKQDTAMYEDFAAINKAINDGKFEFLMLKQIILKWKKANVKSMTSSVSLVKRTVPSFK
jgi:hypothetical protein